VTGGTVARALAAAAFMLTATGCASGFYLSESEMKAYLANLRSETSANDMLRHFQGQVVQIEFDTATPAPHIRSTNILTVLRAIPELFFIEQGFRQIRLDRLSTQIEEQLDVWISERLNFLLQQGGGRVRLEQLERVLVRILSPPTVAYDAATQTASFDLTARVDLFGTLGVSGLLSDGHYRLHVTIDDYRLRGALRTPPPSSADALITLSVDPRPGIVSVDGNASDDVKSGLSTILSQQLASPVREARLLSYDNFAIVGLGLVSAAGGARLDATYRPRPDVAEPIADAVMRGSDGGLYHARRRNTVWSAPVAVALGAGVTVSGDPALVASGSDQLELVAVGSGGDLVYARWRGGRWGNVFRTPATATRFAAAKPALVATAPGQLEIVAVGVDGRLHHVRRTNGQWPSPTMLANPGNLAAAPLRNPIALHVGNKIVVLYGDALNRIFAAAFDLETGVWGQSFMIPSQGTSFPVAAAACSDGRVDVIHVRADGTIAQRQLDVQSVNFTPRVATSGISMYPETVIGGRLAAGPTLACSGYRRMELVGRTADDRLWHNHFSSGPVGIMDGRTIAAGWQGWEEVSDRLFGTLASGRISGTIAAGSTRPGEVHVLMRDGVTSGRARVVYNSYDGARFGYSPWKAVHWRGLEQVSTAEFVGDPALAVWGRQLEVAAVGRDGNLWHSRLADAGLADFRGVSGTGVLFPFEPVVLSSGPGIVDVLYPSTSGGHRHLRRINGFPSRDVGLSVPSGLRFSSPVTAVSFGVGQIEVVGLSQNRTLHHWRYRRGAWESPRQIPGPAVISAPVLVNVGAGQLELLAIGQDQRLHHWRFAGAQWTAAQPLAGTGALSAVLFGPLAAASGGDGTVDVIVVEEATFGLFHRRIYPTEALFTGPFVPPGTPRGSFIALGGTVVDVPSLTAFGADRLLVVVPGTDGQLYENWGEVPPPASSPPPTSSSPPASASRPTAPSRPGFPASPGDVTVRPIGDPGLHWSGYRPLGTPGLIMGGAARLGDHDLVLVTVDRSGRIHHARYNDGRWSGFWILQRQTGDVQGQPATRPAVTVH
jgi:hypothetical protein